MSVMVQYASEDLLASFHGTLARVAREKIYIEMIEAPPFEKIADYQRKLIAANHPSYFAVANGEVVGWADITPLPNPRMSHRGGLGMGLVEEHRGKGLGRRLLQAALDHAKRIGLEKVELSVYTSNDRAIRLYKKMGFTEIGVIKHYRKLDGQYFDCLDMEMFL